MRRTFVLTAALLFAGLAPAQPPQADPNPSARIALVSDTHILRKSDEKFDRHRRHLDLVIQSVNAVGVDLVLIAGDLTEDGEVADFRAFAWQVSAFQAPVWLVPGNHDTGGKRLPGKPSPAKDINRARLWRYELVLGESYFVREHAGVRVVGINSSLLGSGLRQERRMWRFFDRQLAPASSTPTIFLLHYPVFSKSPDEGGGEYWNVEPGPRRRLLELVERTNARAVLSGHLHQPLTNEYRGVLCYTTPPTSYGLPEKKQPEGWTLVTVRKDGKSTAEFCPITTKPAAAGSRERNGR